MRNSRYSRRRQHAKEIGGDAVLYVDTLNPKGMADQMKKIFKDEQLRNNLIEAGNAANKFSWDKTAALLWENINKIVSE